MLFLGESYVLLSDVTRRDLSAAFLPVFLASVLPGDLACAGLPPRPRDPALKGPPWGVSTVLRGTSLYVTPVQGAGAPPPVLRHHGALFAFVGALVVVGFFLGLALAGAIHVPLLSGGSGTGGGGASFPRGLTYHQAENIANRSAAAHAPVGGPAGRGFASADGKVPRIRRSP